MPSAIQSRISSGGKVKDAVAYVRSRFHERPSAAIILGSGLDRLAERIQRPVAIPFSAVPGFSRSTARGHRGELIGGELFGQPIIAMAGRFHRYEGHDNDAVMFPVSVMAALGAERLIVSNAAGGLNPDYRVGDLMLIQDHINWLPGSSDSLLNLGPRPVGSLPRRWLNLYDDSLRKAAVQAGMQHNYLVHQGTYLATLGPTYETRAEYRMMRLVGADVVGMSTVPEVLMGVASGMRVLAISMVSNIANPDRPQKADHQEVLAAGRSAAVKMEHIVRAAICAA